ncbi:MAG: type 2 lantipeptide synthetase LanM family protein [Paenibacillus sp.]|uniref:type 2 lanthipeptide synthetase LanM family protein n=1 Tax=Paenibacillus sp. TaxID=58172 RepID=UPI0025F9E152|nr:type 2 lanthipeptide synthetase LanM family protein [Paenibacillus sp.]MBR2565812.1 type 2 lantipeptide synthetase LanM family protein [Paenibacillus sp.]
MSIQEQLNNSRWGDALYLKEKYKQFELETGAEFSMDPQPTGDVSSDDERMKLWLDQFFQDQERLADRFQAESMEIHKVNALFHTPNFRYAFADMVWHQELQKTFLENEHEDITYFIEGKTDEIPFFEFSQPFLERSIQIMKESLSEGYDWLDKRRVIGLVLKTVSDKVFHLSAKTLIYELNKARLQEELVGDDSRQRYLHFVSQQMQTREQILNLLLEYPVLARGIAEQTLRINQNMIRVLERLTADRLELESLFDVKLDRLEDIEFLGDSHNGGASVLRLKFTGDVNVMYKPRDMAIDTAFAGLLHWFNEQENGLPFRITKTLDRSEYGWQQFIAYEEVASLDEAERFFERQGQYLAILYALNATDMHMENIVAQGEHPFFVDLESLLHNQPFKYMEEKQQYTALEKTLSILNDSVLKTSMLPTLDSNALYHSDLSGLAGDIEQVLNTYEIHDKNTDMMRIKRSKIAVTRFSHLPSYNQSPIKPERYIYRLKEGFCRTYRSIMEQKDRFISEVRHHFHGCAVRTIVRPTVTYFTLIEAGSHPKYLRNGLDKSLLFDMMWAIVRQDRNREKLVSYECHDLLHGDVPMFKTLIGEKILFHHSDDQPIEGVYDSDILTQTETKVQAMNEDDMDMQWEFTERTLQTKYVLERSFAMEKSTESVRPDELSGHQISTTRADYLREAVKIGDYIKGISIMGDEGDTVSWISMGMDADEKLIYKSSELGLYNGVTGIAYFYLYLGQETGEEKYKEMVGLCIQTAWEMIRKNMDRNISLFTGYGSLLYLLVHKAKVYSEQDVHPDMLELLDILDEMVEEDERLDVISGCAGTIIACVDLYTMFHLPRALDTATRCANRLLQLAQPMEQGIAWVTSAINKVPLSGIAHGNAGICLSLARLYRVTGHQPYLEACLEGMKYEENIYSPEVNNWKDLRFTDGNVSEEHYVMYWCNGAPGLGIARVGTAQELSFQGPIEALDTDIRRAVNKTIEDGFTEVSYSLCHGDMGNLELILLAADYWQDDTLEAYAYQMADYIITKVREDNGHWRCGIPSRQQIPGLMLGLAGIGYQLLRLYNRKLPSVLMMEGPARHDEQEIKQITQQDMVEMASARQHQVTAESASESGESYV